MIRNRKIEFCNSDNWRIGKPAYYSDASNCSINLMNEIVIFTDVEKKKARPTNDEIQGLLQFDHDLKACVLDLKGFLQAQKDENQVRSVFMPCIDFILCLNQK